MSFLIPIKRVINFVFFDYLNVHSTAYLLPLSLYLSFSTMPYSNKRKQVRFAYKLNKFHSPVTPALTFASSIPTSSGPRTPPRMSHGFLGPSPYYPISSVTNFLTKPPHYKMLPPRAHPLLESAAFIWDLIEKPTTIAVYNYTISSRLLLEQATNPPLPALFITSTLLPWTIHVRTSNRSYVTLEDLFDAIYHSLRINIATNEFISLHQTDQTRATRAYEQRYRRFRSITGHDLEKRSGMKRVDFLMGHTRFHSISKTGRRPDEWQLNVA